MLKVAKRYNVQYFIITKLKAVILDSVTKKEDFLNYKISNKEKNIQQKKNKDRHPSQKLQCSICV